MACWAEEIIGPVSAGTCSSTGQRDTWISDTLPKTPSMQCSFSSKKTFKFNVSLEHLQPPVLPRCESGAAKCLMNTWCKKCLDCVMRERWGNNQFWCWVTGSLSLHPLSFSFPVALLAPNVDLERCEQLISAPGHDRFFSDLFHWLLPGL